MQKPDIREMNLADLKPAPYNPRKIDPAALAGLTKSLDRFGYVEPIIWNQKSGFVVGGHQRLKVLKTQKVKSASVVVVDLDDTDERALNVALNSPHIAGDFTAELQLILEQVRKEDEQLFNELRFAELVGDDVPLPPVGDPEHVPEPPKVATSKPGDLYILGRHKLLCGDSTSADDLKKLMGSDTVDSLVTDPPYGVDYGNDAAQTFKKIKTRHLHIKNDKDRDYRSWFAEWLGIIPWSEYATFYICMSSRELHNLRLAVDDCGLFFADYLVWSKDRLVMGRKDYKSRFEPILYGWPERHRFYGDATRTSVLDYKRPHKADLHPTMKPIELIEQLITDGSPDGAVILDLFGGSGSTMIAAEKTGRSARLMEIEPIYCDVIVQRWEEYTGKKAVCQNSDGHQEAESSSPRKSKKQSVSA